MKKVLFVLILIVLTGGVWYVNKNASSDNFDKGNFDKAVQLMQNLQSSAIPSSLTSDQLATLETAYNDATARQPSIEAFRTADRASLEQIFTANNITGTLKDDIVNLANSLVDDYNAGIDTKLAALPTTVTSATRTAIKRLTDSINSLSNDIRLTIQFISWYAAKRPNICEKTADPTNNQYIKGTITFRYDEARTPVIETCDGNTLSEYYCSGLEYIAGDPLYNKIRTCEFGCNDGACLKGSLGAVSTVNTGTASGTVMTDIRANQTFYLKLTPTRVHTARAVSNVSGTTATVESGGIGYTAAPTVTVTGGTCTVRPTARATIVDGSVSEIKLIGAGNCTAAPTLAVAAPIITAANTTLTAVVDSASFEAQKCTLTTKTLPIVTSGVDLYFGPIACNTVENHTFTLNLKDGTQTIGTVDKVVTIGGVSMGRFEITAPDRVAAGNDFSITIKTIGNNGLPITSYADDFFIIVDGDDEATFPAGAQRMVGTSEKVISGLRFSQGGSIKITVRGVGVTDTVDKTITVTGAKISVKKNNATSYARGEVTFNVGDTYAYKWEGVNGTSAISSYISTKASGGDCGSGAWVANTLNGTHPGSTLVEANRGCTYTITYRVTNSSITNTPVGNNTATDTLIFKVNE